jgi:hypothetical protein
VYVRATAVLQQNKHGLRVPAHGSGRLQLRK